MRQLVRPRTLARRPLNALRKQWPLALDGDATGVHQARVASRRLRAVLPILGASPRDPEIRKLRKEIRALTRALGPVRELDVALESLAETAGSQPDQVEALAQVRPRLEAERAAAGDHLDRVRHVDLDRLAARVMDVVPEQAGRAAPRRTAARVAERLGARSRDLERAVRACGTLFSMAQLHAARIALKKFRYALELGERAGRFRLTATLRTLKDFQDQLGHLHDLHVLASRIRDCACTDAAGHRDLELVALGLDEEMRRLHSAFLAERHRLTPVLARARRVRVQLGMLATRMVTAPAPSRGASFERRAG